MREHSTEAAKEFKKNEQLRMQTEPLTFPYIDYSYIQQFPLSTRCLASLNLLSREDLIKLGIKEDYLPDIQLARWKAGKYVINAIKEKGLIYDDIAEITGIDKTLIAKMSSCSRPLSSGVKSVVPLCYDVLHESCHKVLFGVEGKIVLPAIYSQIARLFAKMDQDQKDAVLVASDDLRTRFNKLSPTVAGVGMHREPYIVARERTTCLANEWGKNYRNFLGDETARRVSDNMKAYLLADDVYEPSTMFAMFLSLETGIAIDYFFVEDFTKYVPCFYNNGTDIIKIEDRQLLKFIGNVVAVDQETSIKMTAPVYASEIGGKNS